MVSEMCYRAFSLHIFSGLVEPLLKAVAVVDLENEPELGRVFDIICHI